MKDKIWDPKRNLSLRCRRAPPADGLIINTPLELVMETEDHWIERSEDEASCGVKRHRLPKS